MLKVTDLKVNDRVSYSMFKDVLYKGQLDNGNVVMEDKNGNTKEVYKSLFEKYAVKIGG